VSHDEDKTLASASTWSSNSAIINSDAISLRNLVEIFKANNAIDTSSIVQRNNRINTLKILNKNLFNGIFDLSPPSGIYSFVKSPIANLTEACFKTENCVKIYALSKLIEVDPQLTKNLQQFIIWTYALCLSNNDDKIVVGNILNTALTGMTGMIKTKFYNKLSLGEKIFVKSVVSRLQYDMESSIVMEALKYPPDASFLTSFITALQALPEFNNNSRGGEHTKNDSYLIIPSNPTATTGLKFYDRTTNKWRVKNVNGTNMSPSDVIYCAEVGYARFNTKLVRNLSWLVHLQRIMRVVLTGHLQSMRLDTPVIQGMRIANTKVTEYDGDDKYDDEDFEGTKYDVL
jgi:hypothetical protein